MSVHDVPRSKWAGVLDQFSRTHRGWLTQVTRIGPGPELLSTTELLPLQSIVSVVDGTHVMATCVHVRDGPTVCVGAPRALAVDRLENGTVRGLEIDGADGEFVRVTFRATARPEELDGLAPAELETSWRE